VISIDKVESLHGPKNQNKRNPMFNKLVYLTLATIPNALCALDHSVDFSINHDSDRDLRHPSVSLNGHFTHEMDKWLFLASQEVSVCFNKEMNMSAGIGARRMFKNENFGFDEALGVNIFWDHSRFRNFNVHQIGYGIEYLTPKWSFRANFYHPVTDNKSIYSSRAIIMSSKEIVYAKQRWTDLSVTYKGRNLSLTAGPTYNYTTKKWGTKVGIAIPINDSLSFGVANEWTKDGGAATGFSISYRLFGKGSDFFVGDPVIRSPHVKYSKTVINPPKVSVETFKDPTVPKAPKKDHSSNSSEGGWWNLFSSTEGAVDTSDKIWTIMDSADNYFDHIAAWSQVPSVAATPFNAAALPPIVVEDIPRNDLIDSPVIVEHHHTSVLHEGGVINDQDDDWVIVVR